MSKHDIPPHYTPPPEATDRHGDPIAKAARAPRSTETLRLFEQCPRLPELWSSLDTYQKSQTVWIENMAEQLRMLCHAYDEIVDLMVDVCDDETIKPLLGPGRHLRAVLATTRA